MVNDAKAFILADDDDSITFADDDSEIKSQNDHQWKIMLVDDEKEIFIKWPGRAADIRFINGGI